jgi:hypothetical protein
LLARTAGASACLLVTAALIGCGGQSSESEKQRLQEEHEQDSSIAIRQKMLNPE